MPTKTRFSAKIPGDRKAIAGDREAIAAYLNQAFATEDRRTITLAIGKVAHARGISDVAKNTNLERSHLYRFTRGVRNPRLDTIMRILNFLDLQLIVQTKTIKMKTTPRRTGSFPKSGSITDPS
jgi:probable addiction module antidote protein